ncbi:MAG: TolC family protein [Chloracidobacterium sp.]|nr:TolC family protein [Chloracidobacterium sp.]
MIISASWAGAQSPSGPLPRKLTLAQAEELLVQRNLAVLAARYKIDSSRAARLIAGYKPNPMLRIGAEQFPVYSPLRGSYPRFFATNSNAGAQPTYGVSVDKVWERGGKRELRVEQADATLKTSEAQMLDAIRSQIYQLRQAFAAATLARENLRLAETTWQEYEQTEKLTATKVELGDQAGLEIYRVRAGRLQFQQAVLDARSSYEQATRDALNLLGARPEDLASPPGVAESGSAPTGERAADPLLASVDDASTNSAQNSGQEQLPESLQTSPLELVWKFDDRPVLQTIEELRSMALSERPDVQAARYTLQAAESALKLAKAQRTRDVIITYEYQRVGDDHAAGVAAQVPLFTYNNQRAGITQAEADVKAAEALVKQAELQAMTDVEKAYQAHLTARRKLDLFNSQNLDQVEKLRQIATYSYKEGASSLIELLDAQRYYNQALTSYNQARADYQSSLWQLEQATGRSLR